MRIVETIVFRGPSHWSARPVIQLKSVTAADSQERLMSLVELVDRLQRVTGLVFAGLPSIHEERTGHTLFAFEYEEEALTRECINTALRLLEESGWRLPELTTFEERRLVDMADDVRLGPSSRAILDAATARGIPFHRLNRGSLVQLGEGRHQRRIWTAETDATSAIAEAIASDKQLTRSLLETIGVNVPLGTLVSDAEDAWRVAQLIGLPVAVKPCNANHARGVSLDLRDRDSILAAYEWAKVDGETDKVMVEQFILGDHHRLLVVGDKMVAASRGQREYVVGDGRRTIRELVAEINRDPRRGENYTDLLGVIPLDDAAAIVLSKQRHHFDSIPTDGEQVLVKHVGDLIEDCTSIVHPSTAAVAVLAAKTVGLDIAGLDVVAGDISKPLAAQRGGIVEVNAGPSLSPHVSPLRGRPQPVGEAIIEMLFPPERAFRIPIIVVVSKLGNAVVAENLLSRAGVQSKRFALHSRSRMHIDGRSLPPTSDPFRDIRGLLGHPFLDGLIVEAAADDVIRRGFPCRRADKVVFADDITELPADTSKQLLQAATHLLSTAGTSARSDNQASRSNNITNATTLQTSSDIDHFLDALSSRDVK